MAWKICVLGVNMFDVRCSYRVKYVCKNSNMFYKKLLFKIRKFVADTHTR